MTKNNPAYRQEFFGPVALIFPAKDEEVAIAIANDSPFDLGGSVYTTDIERGKRVASRMETVRSSSTIPMSALRTCLLAELSVLDTEKNSPILALKSL